jgi:hypothetical protein
LVDRRQLRIKIRISPHEYLSAISTVHREDAQNIGAAGLLSTPQLLILAGEIQHFESLGPAEDFYPKS